MKTNKLLKVKNSMFILKAIVALNLVYSFQAAATQMCVNVLVPADPNAMILQETLQLEDLKLFYHEKKKTLISEVSQLEIKVSDLESKSQLARSLELVTKGPSIGTQIRTLKSEIKDKIEKLSQLPIESRRSQLAASSALSIHVESSLRNSFKDLFLDATNQEFTVLKKDPLIYLPENRVGFPITIVDKELSQTFNLIGILNLTNKPQLLPSDFQWYGLIEREIYIESPNFYINLKAVKALDSLTFEAVGNSKIAVLLDQYEAKPSPEIIDRINNKINRSAPMKKQMETIIGFIMLAKQYKHDLNKPLLESYLNLISLNVEDFQDKNGYLKNLPTSVILLAQTLDLASQNQLTALNLAIVKKIMETGVFPTNDQYFAVLKVNFPKIFAQLEISISALHTSEVTARIAKFMPEFTASDYRVADTAYLTSFEGRITQVGARALSRSSN